MMFLKNVRKLENAKQWTVHFDNKYYVECDNNRVLSCGSKEVAKWLCEKLNTFAVKKKETAPPGTVGFVIDSSYYAFHDSENETWGMDFKKNRFIKINKEDKKDYRFDIFDFSSGNIEASCLSRVSIESNTVFPCFYLRGNDGRDREMLLFYEKDEAYNFIESLNDDNLLETVVLAFSVEES